MKRWMAAAIIVASAFALAAGPALVFAGLAHASTAPVTRIGWNVAQDACLGVPHDRARAGQQLAIMDCSSNLRDRAEAWVLNDGHIRLHGTGLWVVVNDNATVVLSRNPGRAYWTYGPTHTIHVGRGFLTSTGHGHPFFSAAKLPAEQIWYAWQLG